MNSSPQKKPIAYDSYEELADYYAAGIDTKPHNAYYDRPAMTAMWPELSGKRVLDAGCGPGVYAELLHARGAIVTAIDVSDRMIFLAKRRVGAKADIKLVDMTQPLTMFANESFDFVNAPLCLDYIEDWRALFSEFKRILKSGGEFQFSCGHPAFDAEYYNSKKYFSVEQTKSVWGGFGKDVVMHGYRRSLQEIMMPLIDVGFVIQRVQEPLPTTDFRRTDPRRYESLMQRPAFLCVQARKVDF